VSRPGFLRGRPEADIGTGLGQRYRRTVWLAVFTAFAVAHALLFGFVHNHVDMRQCIGYSPDPVLTLIPFDLRWEIVTVQLYVACSVVAAVMLLAQAVRGAHAPALRFTLALTFMTSMRMATLLMIPLCGPTVPVGGPPPLQAPAMLHLGLLSVPWRMFAVNDMVYSGHTSFFLLVLLATRTWAPALRLAVALFVLLMMYGLLAARNHYAIDLLLAFPCSYFADMVSVALLRRAASRSGETNRQY
jgi:hypothetical protein